MLRQHGFSLAILMEPNCLVNAEAFFDATCHSTQAHLHEEVPAEGNDWDLDHGGEQFGSSDRAVPVHVDEDVLVDYNDGESMQNGEQAEKSD